MSKIVSHVLYTCVTIAPSAISRFSQDPQPKTWQKLPTFFCVNAVPGNNGTQQITLHEKQNHFIIRSCRRTAAVVCLHDPPSAICHPKAATSDTALRTSSQPQHPRKHKHGKSSYTLVYRLGTARRAHILARDFECSGRGQEH